MSVLNKFLARGRIRTARKNLALTPTARNYVKLAKEHAVQGRLGDVIQVCHEGLELFREDRELKRLQDRAKQMLREGRTRELLQELKDAPRNALWKELCELYLESGEVARAEETAESWFSATSEGEAQYYRAKARTERFFTDRRRDDGRLAFELIDSAEALLSSDDRPLRLRLHLASRCGAWQETQRVLARLLELLPGDPTLEARFRTVSSLSENAKSIDESLREVEKTGRLVDDEERNVRRGSSGSVRPLLQQLAAEPGIRAAVYLRGGTALVQGPRGATAERTARSVREIGNSSRSAARRLGLGQTQEVRLEGDFGTLLVSPAELGAGALWCTHNVTPRHEEAVRELGGFIGQEGEEAEQ